MHKVEISYALVAACSKDALLRNPLMDMLHAVRAEGSIAKAAKALGLSYRGVCGALKNHEQTLSLAPFLLLKFIPTTYNRWIFKNLIH